MQYSEYPTAEPSTPYSACEMRAHAFNAQTDPAAPAVLRDQRGTQRTKRTCGVPGVLYPSKGYRGYRAAADLCAGGFYRPLRDQVRLVPDDDLGHGCAVRVRLHARYAAALSHHVVCCTDARMRARVRAHTYHGPIGDRSTPHSGGRQPAEIKDSYAEGSGRTDGRALHAGTMHGTEWRALPRSRRASSRRG